jgi:hypothetical protein
MEASIEAISTEAAPGYVGRIPVRNLWLLILTLIPCRRLFLIVTAMSAGSERRAGKQRTRYLFA